VNGGVVSVSSDSVLTWDGGELSVGAATNGGLIWAAPGTTLSLHNLELFDGFASGDGGLVYSEGYVEVDGASFGVRGPCEALGYGGAIYVRDADQPAQIDRARFKGCTALKGGAIAVQDADLELWGSWMEDTHAIQAGGALFVGGGDLTLAYGRLLEPWTDWGFGDAVYIDAGEELEVVGTAFCAPTGGGYGNTALEVVDLDAPGTLDNVLFQGSWGFSAVYATGSSDLVVRQGSFLEQWAFPMLTDGVAAMETRRSVVDYLYPGGQPDNLPSDVDECLVESGTVSFETGYVRGPVGLLQGSELPGSVMPCKREFRIHPDRVPAGTPNFDAPTSPEQHWGLFGYQAGSDFDPDEIRATIDADIYDWYVDGDGDGYPLAVDCDDDDPVLHPGQSDLCDGEDVDCDGQTDEDPEHLWVYDYDLDNAGLPGSEVASCTSPGAYYIPAATSDGEDCDDFDSSMSPGLPEVCGNKVDEDCDGVAEQATAWVYDADGDGFLSDTATVQTNCGPPMPSDPDGVWHPDDGTRPETDCDDADPSMLDGLDFVRDADGDTYSSDVDVVERYCPEDAPTGWVPIDEVVGGGDCNDDPDADGDKQHPGLLEECGDGIDNNCANGLDDEVVTTWLHDEDEDGYLGEMPPFLEQCERPGDHWYQPGEGPDGDCGPNDPGVYPGAAEICDGVDNNCIDGTDDEVVATWLHDVDEDGYLGEKPPFLEQCVRPGDHWYLPGEVPDGDCGPDEATIYPGAAEICDGWDNDCNGAIDENGDTPYELDGDGDGYLGDDPDTVLACSLDEDEGWHPVGELPDGDCDDGDRDVHPDAAEVCNRIDDDCDGFVDDAPSADDPSAVAAYPDNDLDGFGSADAVPRWICVDDDGELPRDMSTDATDCNDTLYGVNPAATEVVGNEVDEDCDGYLGDVWVQGGCSTAGGSAGPWAVLMSLVSVAGIRRRRA